VSERAPENRAAAYARPIAVQALMVCGDVLIAMSSVALAYLARFDGSVPPPFSNYVVPVILGAAVAVPLVFLVFGLYGYLWRHVGIDMLLRLGGAVVTLALVAGIADVVLADAFGFRVVPVGVLMIAATFIFIGTATLRALARVSLYVRGRGGQHDGRAVLIAGAGDAGSLLLRDIESQPELNLRVVGFIDDDPAKLNRSIRGVYILGGARDIPRIVADNDVAEVLVAMPGAESEGQRLVLDYCAQAGVSARVMPSLVREAASVGLADLRSVRVTDLLGREATPVDIDTIRPTIAGKCVAVTGAAGSIGSELCRQLLTCDPERLVLIEIDESRLYELYLELQSKAPGVAVMRICDIRDDRKLRQTMLEQRPSLVLHAAAYKHVPLMELEPDEAVRTNVVGTMNMIDACRAAGVERFVLISTDKAVRPKSVMGATKAIAELLVLDACRHGLSASAVRFGNVLGSRGSVVPLFEEQLRHGGPLLVTHPDVTRYFMTIPEAARLVLQSQALSSGGDVFVLDMGEPVRIVDLARKMITLSGVDAEIEFTGLRPAEKLHEILSTETEELIPTTAEKVTRLSALKVPSRETRDRVHSLAVAARLAEPDQIRSEIDGLVPGFIGQDRSAEAQRERIVAVLESEMETLL
jgi:FlaA1/EpsC-like NDP-sugar epimerase